MTRSGAVSSEVVKEPAAHQGRPQLGASQRSRSRSQSTRSNRVSFAPCSLPCPDPCRIVHDIAVTAFDGPPGRADRQGCAGRRRDSVARREPAVRDWLVGRRRAVRTRGSSSCAAGQGGSSSYAIAFHSFEPGGKNDGSVKGQRFFECKPNHGAFVRPSQVRVLAQAAATAGTAAAKVGLFLPPSGVIDR